MWASEHQKWAANLQPTLNKVGGEASLKIVDWLSQILIFFFFEKSFLKKLQNVIEKKCSISKMGIYRYVS